jgi:uncharacterized coiled-coil protein SlyX
MNVEERMELRMERMRGSIEAHDKQIEDLIVAAVKQQESIQQLQESLKLLGKPWQAFLSTIDPRQ